MPIRSFKPITINQQFLAALIGVNMLVMLVASSAFYVKQKKALLSGIDTKLTAVATMARETLPADYHDRITGKESVSDAEYHKIVERNDRLCVDLGLEYIWSLMLVDGRIVFTTATSPDKVGMHHKYAEFFETHSNPELYTNAFTTMKATYKCNHDKWGDIRVALIPMTDTHGRKYLFGSSVRLIEVNRRLRSLVWQSILFGFGVFALSVLIGLWVARVVTNPLHRLTETIREIASGKSGVDADEHGTYEQITLARHFNQLNHALQEKISELEASREHLIGQRDTERRQAVEGLVASERRYRGLLNFAVDGILIGSRKGFIIEANEYICTLFGMSREALIGKNISEVSFTPESLRKSPLRYDLLQKGETVCSERTILRPDASEVVVEMRTKMMFDGTYQSIYRDITERKRTEDALSETRRMLEEAQRMAKLGAWKYDVVSGAHVWSEEVYRIHGVGHDFDLADLDAHIRFFTPESQPIITQAFTRAVEQGEPYDLELEFIRADGQRLWTRASARPVVESGKVIRVDGNFMDITDRKRVERKLKESEERYRQLFEMESDVIMLVENETGRILDINLAAQALYGYGRDELLSKTIVELSDEPEKTHQVVQHGMKSANPILTIPLRRHRKNDGTVFPVEVTGRFFELNGHSVHIAAIRDITERKKAQEFLESWNAILERRVSERTAEVERYSRQLQALTGRLVRAEEDERQRISDVLHEDLQQVLVAARMTLGAALTSVRNAATLETLTHVDSMLTRSLRLTRTLVQEIAVPAVREGDLPFAVGWIADQMKEKFGLHVTLVCEEKVGLVGQNVYICLYRLIQELLFNVVKHAGVKQAIVAIQRNEENGIRITVSDKGCGFSEAALAELDRGGDGFGLFSIRERIEGLCGRMQVVSEAGQGTSVILTVPMRDV